ncbi:unnamed protein product [Protopolystoma xenopodis]|uniref:Uncharacterized protein n=1 Tax=Protopolystoma xenopodis TaxID=117903 RepID=A0A448XBQ2_9PLAT|nr:unnamed protein product [Protopolystoma xenopodis]
MERRRSTPRNSRPPRGPSNGASRPSRPLPASHTSIAPHPVPPPSHQSGHRVGPGNFISAVSASPSFSKSSPSVPIACYDTGPRAFSGFADTAATGSRSHQLTNKTDSASAISAAVGAVPSRFAGFSSRRFHVSPQRPNFGLDLEELGSGRRSRGSPGAHRRPLITSVQGGDIGHEDYFKYESLTAAERGYESANMLVSLISFYSSQKYLVYN